MSKTLRIMNVSWLAKLLVVTLLLSLVSTAIVSWAQAATESSRIAQITKLSGEVMVKKSGGTKEFTAYKNMTLNQGDSIRTGSKSSVTLKILDREDEMTFDANSNFNLSQLKTSGSDKKTTVSMWSGSVYTKASKLVGGDELSIETPTAVMGVRGTNYAVSVQPVYGDTSIFVASGIVTARIVNPTVLPPVNHPLQQEQPSRMRDVVVYPTMQANFVPNTTNQTGPSIPSTISVIDPSAFARSTGPAIIEALVQNNPIAEKEREEFANQLQNGTLPTGPPELLELNNPNALNQFQENMKKLPSVLVNQAVTNGVVTQQDIQNIVRNANQEAAIKLGTQESLTLTPAQQAALEAQRNAQAQREQQQREQEQQREQQKQQFTSVLNQIQNAMNTLNQQNQQAANQKNQEAIERFKASLTPAQLAEFERNRSNAQNPTTTPTPTTPTNSNDDDDDDSGSNPPPTSTATPSDTNSQKTTIPIFSSTTQLTGVKIEVALEDSNGNPITSGASFRMVATKAGSNSPSPFDHETKSSTSNMYVFNVTPYEVGTYSIVPTITVGSNTYTFPAISYTVEEPKVEIVQAMDGSTPVVGAFDVVLSNVSGVKGLELHVLTNGEIYSSDDIVPDLGHMFGSDPIKHVKLTSGIYEPDDAYYNEVVYAVLKDVNGSATINSVEPQIILRVSGVFSFENEEEGMVKIPKLILVLDNGQTITLTTPEIEIDFIIGPLLD